jgi:hypothetical protein
VIVTHDPADLRPQLAEALRGGTPTYGLVCVPARFPLNRDGIGRLVAALDALLQANPEARKLTPRSPSGVRSGYKIRLRTESPRCHPKVPGFPLGRGQQGALPCRSWGGAGGPTGRVLLPNLRAPGSPMRRRIASTRIRE